MNFERSLPCRLTHSEQIERGKALAIARQARNEAEAKRAAEAKRLKSLVDDADLEVDRLAAIVRDGFEPRPVACQQVLVGNEVNVIRTDTGEVVESRAATEQDRQRALFVDPEEESAIAKGRRLAREVVAASERPVQ